MTIPVNEGSSSQPAQRSAVDIYCDQIKESAAKITQYTKDIEEKTSAGQDTTELKTRLATEQKIKHTYQLAVNANLNAQRLLAELAMSSGISSDNN